MQNGYVCLWRKSLSSLVFGNEKCWKIWTWCLMRANFKENTFLLGRNKIIIKPGQFVIGLKKTSAELDLAVSTIHYWLSFLEYEGMVELKKTNKYTIITILNWKDYQSIELKKNSNQNANGTLKETNNNDNNVNNEKESMLSKRKSKTKKTMDDLMGKEILLGDASKTGTPSALDLKIEKKHAGSEFGKMCLHLGHFFNECYKKRFSEDYKNGTFSVSGVAKNISKYKEYSRDDWKKIIEFYFKSKKSQELVVTLEACLSENTIMEYKQKTKKPKYYND